MDYLELIPSIFIGLYISFSLRIDKIASAVYREGVVPSLTKYERFLIPVLLDRNRAWFVWLVLIFTHMGILAFFGMEDTFEWALFLPLVSAWIFLKMGLPHSRWLLHAMSKRFSKRFEQYRTKNDYEYFRAELHKEGEKHPLEKMELGLNRLKESIDRIENS